MHFISVRAWLEDDCQSEKQSLALIRITSKHTSVLVLHLTNICPCLLQVQPLRTQSARCVRRAPSPTSPLISRAASRIRAVRLQGWSSCWRATAVTTVCARAVKSSNQKVRPHFIKKGERRTEITNIRSTNEQHQLHCLVMWSTHRRFLRHWSLIGQCSAFSFLTSVPDLNVHVRSFWICQRWILLQIHWSDWSSFMLCWSYIIAL